MNKCNEVSEFPLKQLLDINTYALDKQQNVAAIKGCV